MSSPFSKTPVGKEAAILVDCINSGDRAAAIAFVDRFGRYDSVRLGSKENQVDMLIHAHKASGGVEVSDIKEFDNRIFFKMRSKKSKRQTMAGLFLSGDGKLEGIMFQPVSEKQEKLPEKATDLWKAIHQYLDNLSKADAWSGVVLVAKGDKILFQTAHGLANRSFNVPIQKDTKFHLASTGKLFTATLVGQLIQEGKLSLTDRVDRFLPAFAGTPTGAVTVRHLLTHTGGVPDVFDSPKYDRMRRYLDATDLASAVHGEPLLFQPGERWSYSNGGFVLLGAIAEQIEGKDYRTLYQERIWKPAGMTETDMLGSDVIVSKLAHIYDLGIFDVFGDGPKRNDTIQYGFGPGPHGGGFSTAVDLFRFARAVQKGKIISPETLKAFTTPTDKNPRYAFGFEITDAAGHSTYGHNGHARSDVAVIPDLDLTVVALGNDLSSPAPLIAREIRAFLGRNDKTIK